MYLEYFSLKRHPFRITPDPSLFFPGGTHGRGVVLDALVYGITTGEGILKVVGEVGSGKTMLCRMLEERLPPTVEIVYLANPNLTARDIVYAIAFELKLEVDAATDRLLVMQKLQNYLLQRHGEGGSVVVFVEEAQGMPLETLEEIRLLSNLETHRHKLMQIVMFGQPELERKLQHKAIRQLRERITHSFHLHPLGHDEIREYLHFRLQSAGCPWPQLFSPRAEKLLAVASGGLTRRINILADKSLLAAYADPATRREPRSSSGEILPMVLPRHVKTAITDSGYRRLNFPDLPPLLAYAVAAMALLALAVVLTLQSDWLDSAPADLDVSVVLPREQPLAVDVLAETVPPQDQVQSETVQAAAAEEAASGEPELADNAPAQTGVLPVAAATPVVEGTVVEATARASAAVGEAAPQTAPEAAGTESDSAEAGSAAAASGAPALAVVSAAQQQGGLIAQRGAPSTAWLAQLQDKSGYTIQLFSMNTTQPQRLEEFLAFLAQSDLLERSYICVISGNASRPEQWLVMHDEFTGVSAARGVIDELPPFVRQYGPYVRNLQDIACAR